MALPPRNGISLCAGAGGLDMGLMLAEPDFHTRCFVEWEEYPRQSIIAAQQAGYFAPAPIWGDLTTFDARPIAGAIDTLLAGYPCQPFSMAGQRKAADDPRHLWPHVARIIRELGPVLEWVFLENVAGHVTLGAEAVLRELRDMGFTPAAGLFSAEEVGAPHERLRWFCVAYRDVRGCESLARNAGIRRADDGAGKPAELAGTFVNPMADPGRAEWRAGAETRHLGHGEATGRDQGASGLEQSSEPMADASRARLQGREQPRSPDQRHRPLTYGSTAECGSARLFPPGPGDADAWATVMAASPDRAPSFARRDAIAAAVHFAAILDPVTAETIEPTLRGLSGAAQLGTLVQEAGAMVDETEALARLRGVADGLAQRTRALRLLGNGVFPLAAAYAWRTLASAHGLGRVDLGTTSEGGTYGSR